MSYNPIIGYVGLDFSRRVIGPDDKTDPAFHSPASARNAVEGYGRLSDLFTVGEIFLEGIFNVIVHDTGDIKADGRTALRFVKACRRRGLKINKKLRNQIEEREESAIYSLRELFVETDMAKIFDLK